MTEVMVIYWERNSSWIDNDWSIKAVFLFLFSCFTYVQSKATDNEEDDCGGGGIKYRTMIDWEINAHNKTRKSTIAESG